MARDPPSEPPSEPRMSSPPPTEPPSARTPRILVVDDDPQIGALLERYLQGQGMHVRVLGDAAQARMAVPRADFDLVLLDLGLPDEDGLQLIRELRRAWGGPIIIVSGRGESVERVVGLELGADDYVSKPFDLRELLARIRSVLRRAQAVAAPVPVAAGDYLFDGMRLDPGARRLVGRQGAEVALTTGEFQLLQVLLDRPNQVLTRDQLLNALHGREAGPYDRSIDMQIGRLRRKLETDPAQPRLIKSVRGAGYLFAAPVQRG